MSELLRNFATWTLEDLAIRKRQDDRINFEGNHVSAQFPLPVRLDDESAEQFSARSRRFWKRLPRQSDLSERLALAFEAFRRSGYKTFAAAHHTLEILREAPSRAA